LSGPQKKKKRKGLPHGYFTTGSLGGKREGLANNEGPESSLLLAISMRRGGGKIDKKSKGRRNTFFTRKGRGKLENFGGVLQWKKRRVTNGPNSRGKQKKEHYVRQDGGEDGHQKGVKQFRGIGWQNRRKKGGLKQGGSPCRAGTKVGGLRV